MESYLEIVSVPAIVMIVYGVTAAINYAVKKKETFQRFVPLISLGLGIALGIVAFYAVPTIIPAENIFTAIVIGGASGLSTTSICQAIKQMKKPVDAEKEPSEKDKDTVQKQ